MLEWCMAHPFLTFWVLFIGLLTIDSMVENISKIFWKDKTRGN